MKVLMITGDKSFKPGHPRFDLQSRAVERLEVLYWGRERLWPTVPEGKFDVVTVQDPFWRGLCGWIAARYIGAAFNVQVHTDLSVVSVVRHVLAQVILRHADSVRVVSEKIKEQVEKLGVHAPIRVLPVYIDIEKFKTNVPRLHDQLTVLWVGRFEDEKDPLYALEVLREIRAAVDARMMLLGAGSLEQELRLAAKALPVEFPGWRDPLPYLAQADAVLSTSRYESYGASIVEALAAGVPVVAPDVGIAKEAGATVVPREELSQATMQVLKSGQRGELKIPILTKDEWVKKWQESLSS